MLTFPLMDRVPILQYFGFALLKALHLASGQSHRDADEIRYEACPLAAQRSNLFFMSACIPAQT